MEEAMAQIGPLEIPACRQPDGMVTALQRSDLFVLTPPNVQNDPSGRHSGHEERELHNDSMHAQNHNLLYFRGVSRAD